MTWAVDVVGLNATQRLVLMLLADCHNGQTGQCNPSADWMLDKTGLKARALQTNLKALEEAGLVAREYIFHGRGKGCSVSQYNLKIGIIGAVDTAQNDKMRTHDNATANECARKKATMRTHLNAPSYKEEPEIEPEDAVADTGARANFVFDRICEATTGPGFNHTTTSLRVSIGRLVQRLGQTPWSLDHDVIPILEAKAQRTGKPLSTVAVFEQDFADAYTQRTAPIPEGRHETATTTRTHSPHSRQSAGSLGGGGDLGDAIARRQARREAERARDERERIGGNSARLGVDCSDGGSGADIIDLPRIADGRYA